MSQKQCRTCQTAFSRVHAVEEYREGWSDDFEHHKSWKSFQDAVAEGCVVCNVVWDAWKTESNSLERDDFLLSYRFYSTIELTLLPVHITFSADVGVETLERRDFVQLTLRRSRQTGDRHGIDEDGNVQMAPVPSFIRVGGYLHYFGKRNQIMIERKAFSLPFSPLLREHAANTGSESTLELAKTWMKECRDHHIVCKRDDTGFMPTRLLDVGTENDDIVRVYSPGEAESHPYATLSHCWGQNDILKLTAETKEELERGIELSRVPKTFQDAIQVTRGLSLRFLWIDSLAIFQDSKEDWRKESSVMGEIYMQGVINIAATASKDGREGLFRARNAASVQAPRIKLSVSTRGGQSLLDDTVYFTDPNFWEDNIEAAVLNTRGWVFQERLLSPRVLHFGRQLFWECRMTTACETFPTGREDFSTQHLHRPFKYFLETLHNFDSTRDLQTQGQEQEQEGDQETRAVDASFARRSLNEEWHNVVMVYSRRTFTNATDAPVALTGVAKQIQQTLADSDHYLAGLWASMLPWDLMWRVGIQNFRQRVVEVEAVRTQPLPAPTWSWLSVNTPILPHQMLFWRNTSWDDEVLVEVTSVGLAQVVGNEEIDENAYGTVLILEGRLFAANMRDDEFLVFEVGQEAESGEAVVDTSGGGTNIGSRRLIPISEKLSMVTQVFPDDAADYRERVSKMTENIFALPIYRSNMAESDYEGILLERIGSSETEGKTTGTYHRIGKFDARIGHVGLKPDFDDDVDKKTEYIRTEFNEKEKELVLLF